MRLVRGAETIAPAYLRRLARIVTALVSGAPCTPAHVGVIEMSQLPAFVRRILQLAMRCFFRLIVILQVPSFVASTRGVETLVASEAALMT